MCRFAGLMIVLSVFGAPAVSHARAAPVIVLEDPRGDDNGPGSYTYPSGSEYRPGDFDLRRFEVRVEGQEAVFEVTLGAKVRRDVVPQRGGAADLDLDNGIYVQNVDIYLDTTEGAGFTEGLPGRRVAFPPESAWDLAIAITPRPGPMRTVLNGWNLEAAQKVITPMPVRTKGSTLTVRVPLAQLGGEPKKSWGWSVMVSGAAWEQGFGVVQRIAGTHQADAFTLPVLGVPEERAFGGGRLGSGNPNVIDVIVPKGQAQAQVLGRYTPTSPAVVPMVYLEPRPKVAAAAPASDMPRAIVQTVPLAPPRDDVPELSKPEDGRKASSAERLLKIASRDGDTVVIPNPEGGVAAWKIGTVLDEEGHRKGRVVVTTVSNGFLVATVTEGQDAVKVGHQVRFGR